MAIELYDAFRKVRSEAPAIHRVARDATGK
jgi:hypothetical protein